MFQHILEKMHRIRFLKYLFIGSEVVVGRHFILNI